VATRAGDSGNVARLVLPLFRSKSGGDMRRGDLVRMKYRVFWDAKYNRNITYSDTAGLVVSTEESEMLRVLHEGRIRRTMQDHWKVVNENSSS
jgi:hypothetical protein